MWYKILLLTFTVLTTRGLEAKKSSDMSFLKDLGLPSCFDGQYYEYKTQKCEKCTQNCKTCFGNSANCTSCELTSQFLSFDQEFVLNQHFDSQPQKRSLQLTQAQIKIYASDDIKPEIKIPPKPNFLLDSSNQSCRFCQETQNYYFSISQNQCETCKKLENCAQCLDYDLCLKCAEGYLFDLELKKCIKMDLCDKNEKITIEILNTKICRSRNDYYIDSNSQLPFEFGTFEYPYKNPHFAAKEIFNSRDFSKDEINLFLEEESIFIIDALDEPMVFANLPQINFKPYSKNFFEVTKKPVFHMITSSTQKIKRAFQNTSFNFQQIKNENVVYQVPNKIKSGQMRQIELLGVGFKPEPLQKIVIFESSASFFNISFKADIIPMGGSYIEAHRSLTKKIIVDSCYAEVSSRFLYTGEGYQFEVKRSQFLLVGLAFNFVVHQLPFGRNCDFGEINNRLEFYDNVVTQKKGLSASDGVIYLHGISNATIYNNTFNNIGGRSLNAFMFQALSQFPCSRHGAHKVVFKNNTIIGNLEIVTTATTLFHIDNRDQAHFFGKHYLSIVDNVFKDFRIKGEFIRVDSAGKGLEQFLLQGNLFENIYFSDTSSSFIHSLTPVIIKDSIFRKLNSNSLVFVKGFLQIQNVTIQEVTGTGKAVQNFIQVSLGSIFQIEKIKVEQVRVQAYAFSQFEGMDQVLINEVEISQSSFLSHIFLFQDTYYLRANSIEVTEVDQGQMSSFASYLFFQNSVVLKDKSFDFQVISIRMNQSKLGLYQLQKGQKITSSVELKHQVSFEQIKIKNAIHNSVLSEAFISLPAFVSKDFIFKLNDVKVAFMNSNQPFLLSKSNSKIEITNIETQNIENSFLVLQPSVQDKETIPLDLFLDGFYCKDSFFKYNHLIIGSLNSKAEIKNMMIKNITSLSNGAVIFLDQNYAETPYLIKNSIFEDCNSIQGGVATLRASARIIFEESKFINNFAIDGGVVYVTDQASASFINCTFENNQAYEGHILKVINSKANNYFYNSQFKINGDNISKKFIEAFKNSIMQLQIEQPKSSGYIVSLRSEVSFKGSLYLENCTSFTFAQAQSSIKLKNLVLEDSIVDRFVDLSQSQLDSQNLVIRNIRKVSNSEKPTYLFKSAVGSQIVFNQTIVEDIYNNFLDIYQTKLKLDNFKYQKQDSIESFNSFIQIQFSEAHFTNIKLSELKGNSETFVYSQSSEIKFELIVAEKMQIPFYKGVLSQITVVKSKFADFFQNKQNQNLAATFELQDSFLKMYETTFQNFNGYRAITVQNQESSKVKRKVIVLSSSFKELKGQDGAAISINNSDLSITDSQFNENESPGQAGALLLDCGLSFYPECEFELQNSSFTRNKAQRGGAMAFNLFPPNVQNVSFQQNQASLGYGENIASYPVELRLEESPSIFNSGYSSVRQLVFSLRDHFGQPIIIESTEPIKALSSNLETSVLGKKSAFLKEGFYTFEDLYFLGKPGGEGKIVFESKMVDKFIFEKVMKKPFKNFEFTFEFRNCESGEILIQNTCKACYKGSYSLDPKETTCSFCPKHFSCKGRDSLSLEKGYWRTSLISTQALQCLNSQACPGGEEIICSEGYKGVLCAQCVGQTEKGYFAKASQYSCQLCESNSIIWLKIFGVFMMLILYISVLLTIIISSAQRNQYSSVMLRILTNYLQIILIVRNLNIYWPKRIEHLIEVLSITQSIQQDIFQFGCIFKHQKQSSYALTTAILALMPFAMSALGLALWKVFSLVLPEKLGKTYKRNSILTAFTIAYLCFPLITSYTFNAFTCKEIDGKKYFKEDFSIECYGKEHTLILWFVVAPSILVWTIGFPIFTIYHLRRNLARLNERETIIKYGLFYIGLKDEKFFWEILIGNGRKVVVILIAASVSEKRSFLQLQLIFFFLYLNHQLIKRCMPYEEAWLNHIDVHASSAAISAIVLGLLYADESQARNSIILELVFYVLLMINVTFIVRWVFQLVQLYVVKVKEKVNNQNKELGLKKRELKRGFHYNRFSRIRGIEEMAKKQQEFTERRLNAIKTITKRTNHKMFKIEQIQDIKVESLVKGRIAYYNKNKTEQQSKLNELFVEKKQIKLIKT